MRDRPPADALASSQQRRTTRLEILLVLGVSVGYSTVYSVIDLMGKLTSHLALSAQKTTLNPSRATGRPWLDLSFQLARILFGFVPALLALHFLERSGRHNPMGFRTPRLRFDIGSGTTLAAVIGIPGLAFYVAMRAIGLNTTVIPEALPWFWWTVPVLVLSAVQNAFLEEVVVVGYLIPRLREMSWGVGAALATSALLRGSYHLYQGFGGFIGNVVMGIVFALFFLHFKRVNPLIIAHAILDTVAFVGYALLHNHLSAHGL